MKHLLFATIFSLAASPVLADTVIEYGCVVIAKGPSGKVERILPETKVLEPIREVWIQIEGHGLVKRRSMMRIIASRMKAAAVAA